MTETEVRTPSPPTQSASTNAHMLANIEIFASACFFVFGGIYLVLLKSVYLFISNLVFGVLCVLLWRFWRQAASHRRHAHVFLTLVYIGLINVVTHIGTTDSPMIYWGLSTSMAGAFIFDIAEILIWGAMGFMFYPLALLFKPYATAIALDGFQLEVLQFSTYAGLLLLLGYSIYLFQKNLAQLITKLEKKKTELEVILRLVCHDLGNHVSVIDGKSRQMRMSLETLDPVLQTNEHVQKVQTMLANQREHIKSSLAIFESVRNFSLVTAENFAENSEQADLLECVHAALQLCKERLDEKGIQIKVSNLGDKSSKIFFNRDGLVHHVLMNILTNAVKFSHAQGQIDIEIRGTNGLIELGIRDHGIGMPKESMDSLPQSRKGTSGERGSGFGLSIVNAYLEKFGATIQFINKFSDGDSTKCGTLVRMEFKAV